MMECGAVVADGGVLVPPASQQEAPGTPAAAATVSAGSSNGAVSAPVLEKLAAMELQRKQARAEKREEARELQDPRENVQVQCAVRMCTCVWQGWSCEAFPGLLASVPGLAAYGVL